MVAGGLTDLVRQIVSFDESVVGQGSSCKFEDNLRSSSEQVKMNDSSSRKEAKCK